MSPTDRDVGINFVDILFALVVGEAFFALDRVPKMPASGVTHLAFAALLTITSWIGYHRSAHRYTSSISFDVRKPLNVVALFKFTLDIILVVLYWIAVETTEWGFSAAHQSPSWKWSTVVAAAVAGIYVLWDLLAWLGDGAGRDPWLMSRRVVSVFFFIATVVVLTVCIAVEPASNDGVEVVNVVLIVLVLAYRVAKDSIYERKLSPRRAAVRLGDAERELTELNRVVDGKRRQIAQAKTDLEEAEKSAESRGQNAISRKRNRI
jgi:hypothetical protein